MATDLSCTVALTFSARVRRPSSLGTRQGQLYNRFPSTLNILRCTLSELYPQLKQVICCNVRLDCCIESSRWTHGQLVNLLFGSFGCLPRNLFSLINFLHDVPLCWPHSL